MANYESTTDLSLIIDPGGTGDRPGINLRVYPAGEQPLEYAGSSDTLRRTTNRNLAAGGYDDLQNFSFEIVLSTPDFIALNGLLNWSQQQKAKRSDWEIVLYNLAEPYSELALTRNRFKVPGTPLIDQQSIGGNYFNFTYWIAIQGSLQLTSKQQTGDMWRLSLTFEEGTKLTATME